MMRLLFSLPLCASLLPAQQPTIRSGTAEVLVDFVARDQRQRALKGLTAKDVVVKEDGQVQQILSFRELKKTGTAGEPVVQAAEAASAGMDGSVRLTRQIRLVSLVFERLTADGRRFGRQAALDFINADVGGNVYYAVFHIDRAFRVLQGYTNNKELLKKAIERATGEEAAVFGQDMVMQSRAGGTARSTEAGVTAPRNFGAGVPMPPIPSGSADADLFVGISIDRMLTFSQNVIAEELSRASVFGMWSIVRELERLPGRKSMLYFTEGAPMPNALWGQFRGLIDNANRAGVTVYPFDVRGLITRVESDLGNTLMGQAGGMSVLAQMRGGGGGMPQELPGSMTFMGADLAMDSTSAHPQLILSSLAEGTGGFLTANTNDFRPAVRRLSEEFNTYYEVSYRSTNAVYDGKFRKITVEVNRKDASVQAREGYYALPPLPGTTVSPFEAPLLGQLQRAPLPRDLEYRSTALMFGEREGVREGALVFDMPAAELKLKKDEKTNQLFLHLSFLALVKNEKGEVVEKLSRDLPVEVPADKAELFQRGRVIFTQRLALAPGRYTIECAAADNVAGKAAAKRTALVVGAGAVVSDVAIVRRIDAKKEMLLEGDPLRVKDGKVIPTLIDRYQSAQDLAVFLRVQPPEGAAPALYLDLLQEGKLVKRSQAQVGKAESEAGIPVMATVPLRGLAPGAYELRAALVAGEKAYTRSVPITVW